MISILSITVPIFLLIALGYLAGRLEWFSKAEMRVLGRFVIQLALPMLVFEALAQRRFVEVMNGSYLAAYALGSLALMGAAWFTARRLQRRMAAFSALFGMGMSFSNSGFVGYPIAVQLLGPTAGVALALCMLVENILLLPLTLALAEGTSASRAWHSAMRHLLARLIRNPLIIAIVAGLAVSLTGLPLPAPLAKAVGLLASASSAVALIVIGASLVGLELRGRLGDVGWVAFGKLILHPLIVLALLWALPIDGPLRTAALVFAAMPMLSIYPILAQPHGEEAFCAAALLLTTLLSFLTISLWLWIATAALGWPVG
jgi:malonate transporter and related proteins